MATFEFAWGNCVAYLLRMLCDVLPNNNQLPLITTSTVTARRTPIALCTLYDYYYIVRQTSIISSREAIIIMYVKALR